MLYLVTALCCLSYLAVFPSLAVITVPKMPIITPKGDEIILRKKYNNNMSLLNEAFEQKKELFDSEQMLNQEQ